MGSSIHGKSHWSGLLRLRDMMEFFLFGKVFGRGKADLRDNGKIIREDVNGTQTTIVDESNVYYVFP